MKTEAQMQGKKGKTLFLLHQSIYRGYKAFSNKFLNSPVVRPPIMVRR